MATKIIATKKSKPVKRGTAAKAASAPILVARRKPLKDVFGAVTLTHPERVVFPADDITKLDVAEYYRQVLPRLLAGIKGRPLSVIRCPSGISGECFFQKHLTSGLKHVSSVPLKEESGSTGNYVYVDDADAVFELVQFNALEFHPWGATAADPEHAQYLVFDLDPAPEIAWERVVAAAIDVRDLLGKAGLKSFVRTTGGKGLHVVVPLHPAAKWDKAKKFAHALAESFAAVRPGEFLAVASKQRRDGKIFIDYLRNTRGATSVASYSLRARPGAPVAVPLRWDELKTIKSGDAFNIRNVPARLKRMRANPWAGYETLRQDLDSIAELPGT
jgi:bifunctional non-homologous end joining protein LigD